MKNFVGHFFYRHFDRTRLSAADVFRAYMVQMIAYMDDRGMGCPDYIRRSLTEFFGSKCRPPDFKEVFRLCFLPLHQYMEGNSTTPFYILDGLHECDESEWSLVLRAFRDLLRLGHVRVLIVGRESLDVVGCIPECSKATIMKDDTREDIRRYISWRIAEQPLTQDKKLLDDIIAALNEKAHLM